MKRNLVVVLAITVAVFLSGLFIGLYISSSGGKPTVSVVYYGMNVGPNGNVGFVQVPTIDAVTNDTVKVITYYTWNITTTHLNTPNPPGSLDQVLEPLAAKYPNLFTTHLANPSGQGVLQAVTVQWTCYSYNGNNAKTGLTLCAKSELSAQQIAQLTQDLQSTLPSAIISYFS